MIHEYRPDALASAIAESRAALPLAVDALSTTIAEVSGRVPDRRVVEYVSSLWLMHVCDQWVHISSSANLSTEIDRETTSVILPKQSLLSVTEIGQRSIVIQQITSSAVLGYQLSTASQVKRSVSRRDQVLALLGASSARVEATLPYLKVSVGTELRAAWRVRRVVRWEPEPRSALATSTVAEAARKSVAMAALRSSEADRQLRALIALTAPLDLVEHFWEFHSWAAQQSVDARLWYTATAQHVSTAFMHRIAVARERGGRLLVHQHGGGYGIDEQHLGEDHDIAVSDRFYTFGWSRDDAPTQVRALPTAMPQRSHGKSQGMLLMSLPVTREVYRLQSFCLPSHVERAVTLTVDFVARLAADTKVTLRHSGGDRFPMERLAQAQATVAEDRGAGRGSLAASRAALVVHNYLGTSWLETLA
ncbi:MAG: hypothetical protein EBZ52_08500, partial [Actinobacteria bacterium]|nr:hypothetical protein [Actinomycetota bacterium]